MHATKAAVEEGIVPGGGVALLRAAKALDEPEARAAISRSASTSSRAPSRSRCAGSRPTPATKARSWSRRSRRRTPRTGSTPLTDKYEDLVEGRRHRPDQGRAHRRCRTRRRSRRCCSRPRRSSPRFPRRRRSRRRRPRRRHGRDVLSRRLEVQSRVRVTGRAFFGARPVSCTGPVVQLVGTGVG